MTCCTVPAGDTGRFFSRLSFLHRLRYRLLGFEKNQKQLLQGIAQAGFKDCTVLEIGCGAGDLHQSLLTSGAAHATGVDLSERMLAEARASAKAAGLAERTEYRWGDFVEIADRLQDADITILDKVVCCYPDMESMVDRSLARTRRVYALTYPRDRRLTRLGVAIMARVLKLLGSEFRPYVHDPKRIRPRILIEGFQNVYTRRTAMWLTEVYARAH